jgi:hypothetical protein
LASEQFHHVVAEGGTNVPRKEPQQDAIHPSAARRRIHGTAKPHAPAGVVCVCR